MCTVSQKDSGVPGPCLRVHELPDGQLLPYGMIKTPDLCKRWSVLLFPKFTKPLPSVLCLEDCRHPCCLHFSLLLAHTCHPAGLVWGAGGGALHETHLVRRDYPGCSSGWSHRPTLLLRDVYHGCGSWISLSLVRVHLASSDCEVSVLFSLVPEGQTSHQTPDTHVEHRRGRNGIALMLSKETGIFSFRDAEIH